MEISTHPTTAHGHSQDAERALSSDNTLAPCSGAWARLCGAKGLLKGASILSASETKRTGQTDLGAHTLWFGCYSAGRQGCVHTEVPTEVLLVLTTFSRGLWGMGTGVIRALLSKDTASQQGGGGKTRCRSPCVPSPQRPQAVNMAFEGSLQPPHLTPRHPALGSQALSGTAFCHLNGCVVPKLL